MLNQNFEFAQGAPVRLTREPSVCRMVYSLSSLFVSIRTMQIRYRLWAHETIGDTYLFEQAHIIDQGAKSEKSY